MAEKQTVATFIDQSEDFLRQRPTIYKPLNHEKQEIRLMRIHPGQYNDVIHVTLSTVDLANEPFYETVSYTWEDMSPTKQIYIHDVAYNVTLNQHAALRRLRLPNEIKVLWMDVICIDQANLKERAHQVSIMGDVYANAAHTDVWLGDVDDSKHAPMSDENWSKHVEDFETNRRVSGVFKIHPSARREELMPKFLSMNSPIERAEFILHQLAADIHIADLPFGSVVGEDIVLCRPWYDTVNVLLEILRRPWWTRVWVLQEVLLCKGEPQVLFGSYVLPFNVFMKAADCLIKHGVMMRCCMDSMLAVFFSEEILDRLFNLTNLSIIENASKPGHMPLYKAIQLTKGRKVTDIRDHVYGVLGLTTRGDRVEVDYSLTTAQVFASTSWHVIRSSNVLTWLVKGGLCSTMTPSVPTWSVDWVDVDRQGFRYHDEWEMDEEPDWTRTKYNGELELVANQLSSIRTIFPNTTFDDALSDCQNHFTRLWTWLKALEAAGHETRVMRWTIDDYRSNEFFLEFFTAIFRDTMVEMGDVSDIQVRRLRDEDWQAIVQWWNMLNRCMEDGDYHAYPGSELYMLIMAFGLHSQDCTLGFTTDNQLCLVPELSKVGDSIFHIRACCPPMILRRVGVDAFQVVGPAYLRGSMGSEGWRKDEESVITLR